MSKYPIKAVCMKVVFENGYDDGIFNAKISDPIYGYDEDRGEVGLLGWKYHEIVAEKKIIDGKVEIKVLENVDNIDESLMRVALPWNGIVFVEK